MKRLSLLIVFAILGSTFAIFPPIPEHSEETAPTEDDVEASSTTDTTIRVSNEQSLVSEDFISKSEPGDMTESRKSRSPVISVYLRKTKQNPRLPTNNPTANKSEVAEETLINPITDEKPNVLKFSGNRDDISRPNYALLMRPQYYGSILPDMEGNLVKQEENNKFFNFVEPSRKPYVPGNMMPYRRPQQNYANYFGPQSYGYPSGYGIQTGYVPQRLTGYAPHSGYRVQPDYGYRLGNVPDMEENPDEEEDNKFFNLSELLSPPRKPYVPGSIRPYSSPRPNYANFLGPNYGRPSYGQQTNEYFSRPYSYYAGNNGNFNGYTEM